MAARELIICKDAEALAATAADLIVQSAQAATHQRDRFTLVVCGGSTPAPTYQLLANRGRPAAHHWSRTYLFFSDERFVPPEDERSNFGLVRRSLLAGAHVPADHVLPMPTQGGSPAECAGAYAQALAGFFSVPVNGRPPRFDLILLGLGEDGHTASLFPRCPALRVGDAWVTWSPPGTLPPPVDRITLTYPVLNAARQVAFLVAGEPKAAALRDVLEGNPPPERCPAAGVQPAGGRLTWLVDEAAAELLTRRS